MKKLNGSPLKHQTIRQKITDLQNNLQFYRLPFQEGTLRLTLATLDRHSAAEDYKQPYPLISIRKIAYHNELLIVGIRLDQEEEERVFMQVHQTELRISCSVDTHETYLSRYAYFALQDSMCMNGYYDFSEFYWPGFFNSITGKSKYLTIINDRRGMNVNLKPKYAFFYKPGQHLVYLVKERRLLPDLNPGNTKERIDFLSNLAIGYCLADTNTESLHSNHYPFLIPYFGDWNQNKSAIKRFASFITHKEILPFIHFTKSQERLNDLCFDMMEIAPLKNVVYNHSEQERQKIMNDNNLNRAGLFYMWQHALPFLSRQLLTHYHFSYGMKNVAGKPAKKDMLPCRISTAIPELCFLWSDRGDYYNLELRFQIDGKTFKPYHRNTAFFINAMDDPMKFYLLPTLSDCDLVCYFARHRFRISVLKIHYEAHFKDFLMRLSRIYRVRR